MRTEHWVEYVFPGLIFSNADNRRIEAGQPIAMPPNAVGYRTYEIDVFDARREDGKSIEDRSDRKNISGWTYRGEVLTIDDVRLLHAKDRKTYGILLDNMYRNGIARVVKTPSCQHFPLEANDRVIP